MTPFTLARAALLALAFVLAPSARAAEPAIDKWAGLDVGSRGVKPIVMEFVRAVGGWDFTTDTAIESKNTELGTLVDTNDAFDPKRFEATVAAIKELDAAIRDAHKLPPERVRVVVSSGVFTRFKDKAKAEAAKKELVAAVEKAIGRAPDFVNEQQEAELAARAIIGRSGRAGRMMIDIGSGNTKFGWYTADAFETFTIDSGTKAFRDAATKEAAAKKIAFGDAAANLRESELRTPIKAGVAKAKGFDAVTDVQLVGGAAWAFTTFTHPGTGKQARVPLTADDVDTFAEIARQTPAEARAKVIAGAAPNLKDAAAKEVDRVQKVFTPEDLQAAAAIVRAAYAEGKLTGRKVQFFQKGQYAWIAGYLMNAAKLPE